MPPGCEETPSVPDAQLESLYGEIIIGHYRNPRHRHPISDAEVEADEYNPFCGDRVTLRLKLDDVGAVIQVSAWSEGCSIIQASASMMADALRGKTLEELDGLARRFRGIMQGKASAGEVTGPLGDLEALQVVRQFPVRIKCVLLPWTALEVGLEGYRSSQARDQ